MSYTRGHHKQGSSSRGGGRRPDGERGGRGGRYGGRGGGGGGAGGTGGGSGGQSRQGQHSPSAVDVEHMHDRLTFLLAKSVGASAIVTVASGDRYKGLFSAAATEGDLGVVLRQAELLPAVGAHQTGNGTAGAGAAAGTAAGSEANGGEINGNTAREVIDKLVVQPRDVVEVSILNPDLAPDTKHEFRTDADIGGRGPRASIQERERELQRWAPEGDDPLLSQSLEESSSSGGVGQWDQFAANKEKFGVESTYDEHFYTTAIDRSHPRFRERERMAERLAAEIERSNTFEGNAHVAEERGQIDTSEGLDEEDKYSGVDRRGVVPPAGPRAGVGVGGATGKYTPPQLRAGQPGGRNASPGGQAGRRNASPAGQAGRNVSPAAPAPAPVPAQNITTGPPNDPAIISASLATPASRGGAPPPPPPVAGQNGKAGGDIENELIGNFRQFVSGEVERLQQKKLSLQKKEMSDRLNDFKKFSDSYKINAPVPPDLVPLLGKNKEKGHSQQSSPAKSGSEQLAAAATASPAPTTASEPPRAPSGTPVTKPTTSETDLLKAAAATGSGAGTGTGTGTGTAPAKPKFNFNAHAFKPKVGAPAFVPGAAPTGPAMTPSPAAPPAMPALGPAPVAPVPVPGVPVPAPMAGPPAAAASPAGPPPSHPAPLTAEASPSPAAQPPSDLSSSGRAPGGSSRSSTPAAAPATTLFAGTEPEAKPRAGLFNPLLAAKRAHENDSNSTAPVIVKAWATAPTWLPASDDQSTSSYTDRFRAGPDLLSPQPDFYPGMAGFPGSPMGAGMIPVMPAAASGPGGYGDRGSPVMASPPPVPGQMMPHAGMVPGMAGYPPQFVMPAYNMQQFYSRMPQYPQMGMQMASAGGYGPQQNYGSPRHGGQATMSPAGQYYPYNAQPPHHRGSKSQHSGHSSGQSSTPRDK